MKNIFYVLILLILNIAALDEPQDEPHIVVEVPQDEPHIVVEVPQDELHMVADVPQDELHMVEDVPQDELHIVEDVPQDDFVGEISEVPKPYPELIKLFAKFSAAKITQTLESLYHLQVMDILNVTEQPVSGRLYRMTLKVAPSVCEIYEPYSDAICPLQDCYATTTCNVEIWSRVWLEDDDKLQLTDGSCEHGESTCQET